MRIAESFYKMADLVLALGVKNINQLPGCWEHHVDKHWWIAVNAHAKAVVNSHGTTVPAFSMYIEFDGWPAGICDAGGGTIAAGALANEDTFIAALEAATRAIA